MILVLRLLPVCPFQISTLIWAYLFIHIDISFDISGSEISLIFVYGWVSEIFCWLWCISWWRGRWFRWSSLILWVIAFYSVYQQIDLILDRIISWLLLFVWLGSYTFFCVCYFASESGSPVYPTDRSFTVKNDFSAHRKRLFHSLMFHLCIFHNIRWDLSVQR